MVSALNQTFFQDVDASYAKLESVVWPHGAVCPHCGVTDRMKKRGGAARRPGAGARPKGQANQDWPIVGLCARRPITTAKLNGRDPEAYLRAVLTRIADHPVNRFADLLPSAMVP